MKQLLLAGVVIFVGAAVCAQGKRSAEASASGSINAAEDGLVILQDSTAPDVAWYSFEGNANDSSGNDHHGTEFGTVSYSGGVLGLAAQFSGLTSFDWIEIPSHLLEDWTIAVWFRETAYTGEYSRIWDFGSLDGANGAVFLSPHHGRLDSRLGCTVIDTTGAEVILADTGIAPEVDNWYHVAVTFDKDGEGMKVYVNGGLRGTSTYNSESFSDFSSQTWYVARSNWVDPYFDGLIDELKIYDRALSEAEILGLAATFLDGFETGDTSAWSSTVP